MLKPANIMVASLGLGMQALSSSMSTKTPASPRSPITLVAKSTRGPVIDASGGIQAPARVAASLLASGRKQGSRSSRLTGFWGGAPPDESPHRVLRSAAPCCPGNGRRLHGRDRLRDGVRASLRPVDPASLPGAACGVDRLRGPRQGRDLRGLPSLPPPLAVRRPAGLRVDPEGRRLRQRGDGRDLLRDPREGRARSAPRGDRPRPPAP